MSVKVASNKVGDSILGLLMKVLKFMSGGELLDIETIRKHAIGLSLQQMFAFIGGDVRDGGKDVSSMRCPSLNAISVVDATPACLSVDIEMLKIIVKVNRSCAQISTEECSVGGKNSSNVYPAFSTEWQGHTGKPFMKLRDNGTLLFMIDILETVKHDSDVVIGWGMYLAQEPCNYVSKNNCFIGFPIIRWRRNASNGPKVPFPFVKFVIGRLRVEQKHPRRTVN